MSLANYFVLDNDYNEKVNRLNQLKKRFIEEGVPPTIAAYKAEQVVFTPVQLENIKFNIKSNAGLRPSLMFYFESEEELKLVNKYFNVSYTQMAVKESVLLITILKMLEELNVKPAPESKC